LRDLPELGADHLMTFDNIGIRREGKLVAPIALGRVMDEAR